MQQMTEGPFQQIFSLDNRTGRFLMEALAPAPFFHANRRFSCIFVSTSTKDAVNLNQHLLAAGIRAYHAADTREAELLSAITSARIFLIDIDCTMEPGLEVLQRLDHQSPGSQKVVITGRNEETWSRMPSHLVLDVVPKPVRMGELLDALEHAHQVEQEINDPEQARGKRAVVARPSLWNSIRGRLSAMMMGKVNHVWWRFNRHRSGREDSHA